MRCKLFYRTLSVLFFSALLMGLVVAEATPKPIMVHYMPWFQGPYTRGAGFWGSHWTGQGIYNNTLYFNPNNTNTSGQSLIASWYYPQIGPYDSRDPAVLEYHVLLMKLAGIDGVLADWYGIDNRYDYAIVNTNTGALFNYTRKAGLKFGVVCEPQVIKEEVNSGYIAAASAIPHMQEHILYLQTNYFIQPSYLRLNDQPVLLDFGQAYFTQSSDWTNIFSVLNPTNQPAFFHEDYRLAPAAIGAYNWLPYPLSDAALANYLSTFQQNAQSWPAFISSAFPRYHDIYPQIGGTSNGSLSDNNGATFRSTLLRAMTNNSAFIQLVTWNDFGEGTVIEPTAEFGYRDLGVIQDFRRQYFEPDFPFHTNDFPLALRLFYLRKQYANYPVVGAELNRIFTNIISANILAAQRQLAGVEAGLPVLYNFSVTNNQLQFNLGGYLQFGAVVQATTNLATPQWQNVQIFGPSANLQTFSTNISMQSPATYFRVTQ
jgi:hypothetical protein